MRAIIPAILNMNRFLPALATLCLVVSALSQDTRVKRKADLELSKLKGPAHTVKIDSVILENPENIGLSGWLPSLSTYDRKGNLTDFVEYDEKGEMREQSVIERDQAGRKVIESRIAADGSRLFSWVFRYDENGNQIEFDHIGANGSFDRGTRRTFDSRGKMTSFSDIEADGSVDCVTETSFTDDGEWLKESRRCRQEWINFDAVYSDIKTSEGKKSESRLFNMKGLLTDRYVYLTDEKGNRTDLQYEGNDLLRFKEALEYGGWDGHGNWTTEIRTFWKAINGNLQLYGKRKTTRTITYY